jgi:hypothetical protein
MNAAEAKSYVRTLQSDMRSEIPRNLSVGDEAAIALLREVERHDAIASALHLELERHRTELVRIFVGRQ